MRMTAKRKEMARKMLEAKRAEVAKAIAGIKPYAFGHGFLWMTVAVEIDGKKVRFKQCFGSICADDFREVERRAMSVEGVEYTWINVD